MNNPHWIDYNNLIVMSFIGRILILGYRCEWWILTLNSSKKSLERSDGHLPRGNHQTVQTCLDLVIGLWWMLTKVYQPTVRKRDIIGI